MNNDFGHFAHVTPHFKHLSRLCLALALSGAACAIQAQNFPITSDQKATATQVAQTGVPLADLAPNAPDSYSVKRGATLWAISGLFLHSAFRPTGD